MVYTIPMSINKLNIQLTIPVSFLKEGSTFIAYSPVLDLSTSADSFTLVKMRFEELVPLFIEELLKKGTLEKVLTNLGWQKDQKQWLPPVLIAQELTPVTIPVMN